ncbi:MAG: NUDIX hydrolase [Legionellales bacterium]|nr:NUDIX hydrolase [Legionellales bacterium]|tara:strand:- start:723 stop:1181 length:459 start_codon:yes stop_codon:yes gene_type:complete
MQWKPNTTVAAIIEKNDKFLLVEEEIDGKLVFNQPAGHLEKGETLIEAVKREVLEETTFEFEPKSLIGIYLYPNANNINITYLRFCFYGLCIKKHNDRKLDEGIIQTTWMSEQEIKKNNRMRSPMVSICVNDYKDGKNFPLTLINSFSNDKK